MLLILSILKHYVTINNVFPVNESCSTQLDPSNEGGGEPQKGNFILKIRMNIKAHTYMNKQQAYYH